MSIPPFVDYASLTQEQYNFRTEIPLNSMFWFPGKPLFLRAFYNLRQLSTATRKELVSLFKNQPTQFPPMSEEEKFACAACLLRQYHLTGAFEEDQPENPA